MTKSKEEMSKMTVPDLKTALKELNLPVTGKKDELVERYFAALQGSNAAPATSGQQPTTTAAVAAEPVSAPEASAQDPAEEAPAEEQPPTENGAAAEDATEHGNDKHKKIVFTELPTDMPDTSKLQVVRTASTNAPETKIVTQSEKMKQRADRFKDPAIEKLKDRAQRFGLSHPDLDKEKAVKRAQRFGTFHPEVEAEKKKARQDRFGIVDEKTKLEVRAERFKPLQATKSSLTPIDFADFEAKKKARADRFAAAAK